MRVPRPARVLLTSVAAIRLRPWAHLPQRPGFNRLANPRDRLIRPRRGPAQQFAAATQPVRIDIDPDCALTRPRPTRSGRKRNSISPTYFRVLFCAREIKLKLSPNSTTAER